MKAKFVSNLPEKFHTSVISPVKTMEMMKKGTKVDGETIFLRLITLGPRGKKDTWNSLHYLNLNSALSPHPCSMSLDASKREPNQRTIVDSQNDGIYGHEEPDVTVFFLSGHCKSDIQCSTQALARQFMASRSSCVHSSGRIGQTSRCVHCLFLAAFTCCLFVLETPPLH